MKRTTVPIACLLAGLTLVFSPVSGDPLSNNGDSSPAAGQQIPVLPTSNSSNSGAATTPGGSASPTTTPNSPSTSPTSNTPDGLKDSGGGLWDQDTLTGDWGGLRKTLESDGFKVTPTWTQEFFGNPTGGIKQGIEENGLFNVALDFDLGQMTDGAVQDLSIHTNAMYIYGPGLSPGYVGDFSNTSNIQGYNTVRLQELWLQKWFWDKRLSLKVGNIAIDTEFFQSSSASLFINGTFGTFDLIANNISNAPVYPLASPGVRLQFLPTSKFYVMSGVYSMNLNETQPTDAHGTDFAMDGHSGLLVMSEAGFLLNQSPNDRGLQGTYRIGSLVETANWYNWGSQAQNALGTGNLQGAGANYSVYGIIDQQIYSEEDKTISLFMRGGGAPSNVNFVNAYIEGGFNFAGFIPGRANDIAGIGMAHAHVSGNFSDSQVLQGGMAYTEESVLETTYKAQINPWWTVQPDFQYIMNPSGVVGSHNAVVLGVRTSVAF